MTKAQIYGQKLLLTRRYTAHEIKRRIMQKGFTGEEADDAVAYLCDHGYIDDYVYAEKFIKDAIHLKRHGKGRIRFELLKKGVDRNLVDSLLASVEIDETEALLDMMERKFQNVEIDYKTKDKIRRYFAAKGYRLDDINRCMDELFDGRGDFED